jgi:gluconate 2-dehydrogenase gamma chain
VEEKLDSSVRAESAAIRERMSRRLFLQMAGRGILAASALAALGIGATDIFNSQAAAADRKGGDLFTAEERLLLAAVQEHLLPSDPGSPGARDIRATAYLELALTGSDIEPGDLPQLKEGSVALNELARERYGKKFAELGENRRERTLRAFEETRQGDGWLTLLMGYTIEAYVGDPAYGGNPDGIVWKWLGHRPGFPAPPPMTPETRR